MKKVLILVFVFVFIINVFASPNNKGMSQAYKDGYEYSKEHGYEIGKGMFIRSAYKSALYRLIPSCLWVSYSFTLPSHGAVDMIAATLIIPYNFAIIIYDIIVWRTELLINRKENLRQNAYKYLEKEGKDIEYRQEFLDGLERCIIDNKWR
ncbi:MAG: hypothetical protein AB7T10_08595 [bacterium]